MTSLIERGTAIFMNTPLSVNNSLLQNQQHARRQQQNEHFQFNSPKDILPKINVGW